MSKLQFAGIVTTSSPGSNYTPPTAEELEQRMPCKLVKIMRSLTEEQCAEAVRNFDNQIDQVVFGSATLAKLSSEERQMPPWIDHWNFLFAYVFGYAQAKGWTDVNKRLWGK